MKKRTTPDRFTKALKALESSRTLGKNPNDLSPKERLDTANAIAREFANRREEEKWRTKEEAEARDQDTRELVQADLYSTLPLSLAGKLSGRVFNPGEVRQIVRAEVDVIVREWRKGERIPDGCIPK